LAGAWSISGGAAGVCPAAGRFLCRRFLMRLGTQATTQKMAVNPSHRAAAEARAMVQGMFTGDNGSARYFKGIHYWEVKIAPATGVSQKTSLAMPNTRGWS